MDLASSHLHCWKGNYSVYPRISVTPAIPPLDIHGTEKFSVGADEVTTSFVYISSKRCNISSRATIIHTNEYSSRLLLVYGRCLIGRSWACADPYSVLTLVSRKLFSVARLNLTRCDSTNDVLTRHKRDFCHVYSAKSSNNC